MFLPRLAAVVAIAAVLVTVGVSLNAHAVPLAEWEADEAKLLGDEPVTRADLPDEWQELSEAELVELMKEVHVKAKEHYYADEHELALPSIQQCVYLARHKDDQILIGTGLSDIAAIYKSLGQYEKALTYYDQSLAIRRETGDKRGEGNSLNNIGTIYKILAEYEKALEYYEQSLSISREIGDRDGEGNSLNNIGGMHDNLGQYEKAITCFEQSLSIAKQLGDIQGEGRTLNNIGLVYHKLAQYKNSLSYYEQSMAIRSELGDIRGVGQSLNNIGGVYHDLGQYEQALEYYKQSLAIAEESGDILAVGISLNNIGSTHDNLGHYEQALTCYEQYLAIFRERGDLRSEGTGLNNIGSVYHALGRYEQALIYYEQSLAIAKEGDRRVEGASLQNIGSVYHALGQYERALIYYEQSLTIAKEGDRRVEGASLQNIGSVYKDLGQYDQALIYYEQSLAIARELGDIQGEGYSLGNMGTVYFNMEQLEKALKYHEKSLAICREIGDIRCETINLRYIGDVYLELDQSEKALEYYQNAFDISVSQATQFTWESGMNDGLVAGLADTTGDLSRTQIILRMEKEAFATVQSAKGLPLLQLLAQGEHISDDPDVQAQLDTYRNANAALQVYRQQLTELPDEDEVLAEEAEQTRSQCEYFTEMIDEYQAQVNDAWDWLRENAPEITDIIEVKGLTVDEVQAQVLQPGQVVLEYLVVEDESTGKPAADVEETGTESRPTGEIIVFCLPWEGELSVGQATLPDLGELSFDEWLARRLELLYSDVPQICSQAAQELYKLLIAPVAEHIPPDAELIICPDRSLFLVPYEALMNDHGTYLLDQHSISYSSSATMLSYVKPAGGASSALVAGVSFGAGQSIEGTALEQLVSMRSADLARNTLFASREFYPLPGVTEEIKAVADILGVEPLTDEQVTEAVLREYMPGHEVIHLATHGFLHCVPLFNGVVTHLSTETVADDEYRGQITGMSAIPLGLQERGEESRASKPAEAENPAPDDQAAVDEQFTKADSNQPSTSVGLAQVISIENELRDFTADDGFLTMAEVMGIPLAGCELVTLSCCHSAEGQVAPGEGVMGLSQGFLYAGARSVLASLTKVEDEATQRLMVEFYRNWYEEGMSKREALRAAKKTLIADPQFAIPCYWAPFVLYGVE